MAWCAREQTEVKQIVSYKNGKMHLQSIAEKNKKIIYRYRLQQALNHYVYTMYNGIK